MSGDVTVLPLKNVIIAVESASPTPVPQADVTGFIASNPAAAYIGLAIIFLVIGAFLFTRKR